MGAPKPKTRVGIITSAPAAPNRPLIAPTTNPNTSPETISNALGFGSRPIGMTAINALDIITTPSRRSSANTACFSAALNQLTPMHPKPHPGPKQRADEKRHEVRYVKRVESSGQSRNRAAKPTARFTGMAVFRGTRNVPVKYGSRSSAPPNPTKPPANPTTNPMKALSATSAVNRGLVDFDTGRCAQ